MTGTVAAIILAAGRSERMGSPKPLLRLGEKTFLEHILTHPFLRQPFVRTFVVLGPATEDLQHSLSASIRVAYNPHSDRGRTGSLQCGLRALTEAVEGAWVWPVDCPLIPEEVLLRVYDEWGGAAKICIPSHEHRRGHPPLIGASFFSEILQMDENQSLRDLYARHAAELRHVDVNSPWILMNVNTPDDYRRLQTQYEERRRTVS